MGIGSVTTNRLSQGLTAGKSLAFQVNKLCSVTLDCFATNQLLSSFDEPIFWGETAQNIRFFSFSSLAHQILRTYQISPFVPHKGKKKKLWGHLSMPSGLPQTSGWAPHHPWYRGGEGEIPQRLRHPRRGASGQRQPRVRREKVFCRDPPGGRELTFSTCAHVFNGLSHEARSDGVSRRESPFGSCDARVIEGSRLERAWRRGSWRCGLRQLLRSSSWQGKQQHWRRGGEGKGRGGGRDGSCNAKGFKHCAY